MAEQETAAERLNRALFELSRELATLPWSVPEAGPLARALLRVAGRVVIECGGPEYDPQAWAETQSMAVQWLNEVLKPLGYQVGLVPGSGPVQPRR